MQQKPVIQRLDGTVDRLGNDLEQFRAIQRSLRSLLSSYGYQGIDTPVLERTDLYLRKSGGKLASRMYTFTDQGGHRVSLRPEFTASVIRAYIERAQDLSVPLRWQYAGPVFRSEPPQRSQYRQFTQLGAELIGSASPRADAEIISLACQGIGKLGISGHRLVIGHVGVVLKFLESLDLSERVKVFLLNNIAELTRGSEGIDRVRGRLTEMGLVGTAASEGLSSILSGLGESEARGVVQGLMAGMANAPLGDREVDEIVSRFMQKIKGVDEPGQVERGLTLIAQLAQVKGEPSTVFSDARCLALLHNLPTAMLENLAEIVHYLGESDLGDAKITIDLGLARGLAYYTGMVFEVWHESMAGDLLLCGGGRYDGLVKSLGGEEDIPALGFAYGVERLEEALEMRGKGDAGAVGLAAGALVVPTSPEAYGQALRLARGLRLQGQRVEVDVSEATVAQGIEYARKRSMVRVIVVNEGGEATEYRVSLPRGL